MSSSPSPHVLPAYRWTRDGTGYSSRRPGCSKSNLILRVGSTEGRAKGTFSAVDLATGDSDLLSDKESDADALVERLAEAGCDDALVGTGQKGRIALNFIREAASAKEAIISALTDVKRVIPHARLLEVTPDFVGLSDVAELLGVSRQNMRKL